MQRPFALLHTASVLALLFGAVPEAGAADMRQRKKLIATGWDMADRERLRANLAQMEQRPFEGVVARLEGHIDGKNRCHVQAAFAGEDGFTARGRPDYNRRVRAAPDKQQNLPASSGGSNAAG